MYVLADQEGKLFGAVTIQRPEDFIFPFPGFHYYCLIWDHEGRFNDVDRSTVARALLESGCRYAVCAGNFCEEWHDAVDAVYETQHMDDIKEISDADFVMTTWHKGASPDDVAFFFVMNTNFAEHNFQHYLTLHVGVSQAIEKIESAVRKYARNE